MAKERRQSEGYYRSERCREHLCYIVSQGFDLESPEYRVVEVDGQYRCEHCGRTARTPVKLCIPAELPDPRDDQAREPGDTPTVDEE